MACMEEALCAAMAAASQSAALIPMAPSPGKPLCRDHLASAVSA